MEIKKGFGVKNPLFVGVVILSGEDGLDGEDGRSDFIFTPIGDDDGGGGGGVKNKGSVAKLFKFKLSLFEGGNIVVGVIAVAAVENCDITAGLATIVGSDIVDFVPVVVVEVLPHIEDNTKAAATVCSWL